MTHIKSVLVLLLCFCILCTSLCLPVGAAKADRAGKEAKVYNYNGYTTYTMDDCTLEWNVPNSTEGGTTCTALQGMNVGTNYCYVAKKNSDDTYVDIHRINMNTGERVEMDYYASAGATTSTACDVMGHANEINVVGQNGEHFLYVATLWFGKAIARLKIDGTKLIFTGFFDLCNTGGESLDASAIRYVKTEGDYQYFLIKRAKKFYGCKIPVNATGGTASNPTKVTIFKMFTLNTSNAVFATGGSTAGTIAGMDGWTNQGFGYNKSEDVVYVPIWDSANPTRSAILTYNLEGQLDTWLAAGTNSSRIIYPTKTNFLLNDPSTTISEVESVGFRTSQGADGDNRLYIGINAGPVSKEGVYSCTYTSGSGDFTPVNQGTNTYTVKYEANGGTGTTAETNHVNGITTKLRENGFSRTGYSFAGWYLSRKSDGKWLYFLAEGGARWYAAGNQPVGARLALYGDQRNVGALSSTEGDVVTCHAQWTPNSTGTKSFYVEYDPNGGSGTMASTKVVYGTSTATAKNTFTREGYSFVGWTAYRRAAAQWAYKTTDGLSDVWLGLTEDKAGHIRKTYGNDASISKTSDTDCDIVTFYAAWARVKDAVFPAVLKEGSAFTLGGTVESTTDIYKVTLNIKNAAGTIVATHSASPYTGSYDLTAANKQISLATLPTGSYSYELLVQTVDGASPNTHGLLNATFNIIPKETLVLTEEAAASGIYTLGADYFSGFGLGLRATQLKALFAYEITVRDTAGNTVADNATIGTGYIISCGGESRQTILTYDINSDADISTADMVSIKTIIKGAKMPEIAILAADGDGDGTVNSTDAITLKELLKN